jgi:hypothetical protein
MIHEVDASISTGVDTVYIPGGKLFYDKLKKEAKIIKFINEAFKRQ